jgi:predicted DsbA family dithiol-disulfide isomerase
MGNSYRVALCYRNKKGLEMSLAESKDVSTYASYWANHYDEMAMDPNLFNVHFSSLVTKEGEVVDNAVLQEIAQTLSGGVL